MSGRGVAFLESVCTCVFQRMCGIYMYAPIFTYTYCICTFSKAILYKFDHIAIVA